MGGSYDVIFVQGIGTVPEIWGRFSGVNPVSLSLGKLTHEFRLGVLTKEWPLSAPLMFRGSEGSSSRTVVGTVPQQLQLVAPLQHNGLQRAPSYL